MSSLYKINENNFEEYLSSINLCIDVLNSIYFILDSFQAIRSNPHIEAIKFIQLQLEGTTKSIEAQKSYKLFCELIGAHYDLNNIRQPSVPVLILAEAITPQNVPLLPWKRFEDNSFLVYKNNIEESYYSDLEASKGKLIQNKCDYRFNFQFDKKYLSIINEMRRHPRSNEILHLYQNILLIQDIKNYSKAKTENKIKFEGKKLYEEKIDSKEFLEKTKEYFFGIVNVEEFENFILNLRKDIEKYHHEPHLFFINNVLDYLIENENLKSLPFSIDEPNINNDYSNITPTNSKENLYEDDKKITLESAKKKVKSLFELHYKETLHLLEKKGFITCDPGIQASRWSELQEKLIVFGDNLYTIEKNFKSTLIELNNFIKSKNNAEEKKNKLFREVHEFLLDRNLNPIKEDKSKKFPSASQIARKKPGGPGILKKITDYGGLLKFEKEYYVYIEKNKDSLKTLEKQIDPNTLSDSVVRPTLKLLQKSVENNKK